MFEGDVILKKLNKLALGVITLCTCVSASATLPVFASEDGTSNSSNVLQSSETKESSSNSSVGEKSVATSASDEVSAGQYSGFEVNDKKKVPDLRAAVPDIDGLISKYTATVKNIARSNDLYSSVMMAQAILESAAGTSGLAQVSNNLFGIKYTGADGKENIDFVNYDSNEYINKKTVLVNSKFRKYDSLEASFKDYAVKIHSGSVDKPNRYNGVLRSNAKTYMEATKALCDGGYATSLDYAESLNSIIKEWSLQKLDLANKISIDSVGVNNNIIGSSFNVRGWILSPQIVNSVSVIYQGKVIGSGSANFPRKDVATLNKEYQQINFGFNFSASTADLKVGKNEITLAFNLSTGEKIYKKVIVSRPSTNPRLYLDSPTKATAFNDKLVVSGWGVAGEAIKSISAQLDGKEHSASLNAIPRLDVYKLYPEYNMKNSGFSISIPTDKLSFGKAYSLTVRLVGTSENRLIS